MVKKSQIGGGAAVKIERASYQVCPCDTLMTMLTRCRPQRRLGDSKFAFSGIPPLHKLTCFSFTDKDEVVSLISRQSIDVLSKSCVTGMRSALTTTVEDTFRDKVELSDWALIKKMKVEQGVN
jgi:translation initiation factor 5B